jgi:hypothetical protein
MPQDVGVKRTGSTQGEEEQAALSGPISCASSFASKIFIHPCKLLQSRRGVTQLGEPGEMMTDHGFSLLLL